VRGVSEQLYKGTRGKTKRVTNYGITMTMILETWRLEPEDEVMNW